MITIDFETRSECILKKSGAWAYSEHASTKILCLVYKIDGRSHLWTPEDEAPERLFREIRSGALIEAHNVFFERAVWANIGVKRLGWPKVPFYLWRCSAAKTATASLPRDLGGAGRALGLSKTKDEEGKRIMLKLCKPRKITKKNLNEWHEDEADLKKLYRYCLDDVLSEEALSASLPTLSEKELKVWKLDQKINLRGIYIDREAVDSALSLISEIETKYKSEVFDLTSGELDGTSKRDKLIQYIYNRGVYTTGMTKDNVTKLLGQDIPDDVRRLLEIRQILGKSSTAKYKSILARISHDGRIRGNLIYHGANTGRWAGSGFQPHNLPRGTIEDTDTAVDFIKGRNLDIIELIYGNPMAVVSSCIRGMICAPEGREISCGDFNAIEARVLLWLAGDVAGLDLFRKGICIYKDMASDIYTKKAENIDKTERQLGKKAILGLGYGMGDKKFKMTCEGDGVIISEHFAKKVVGIYREKYKRVREFWGEIERAAIKCVARGTDYTCGPVVFSVRNKFLRCKLPSGRFLYFYDPEIHRGLTPWGDENNYLTFMGMDSKTFKWVRQSTYGGKLVENITQAVARDFMAEAMLRLEDKKYPVILTVHDEIISETDKDFGNIEDFTSIMSGVPDWGKGCPIKVEAWRGTRYKK